MLTKREKEVLVYVCKGYTNEEIAQELCISLATAKAHVSSILIKYAVRNRTYLAYLAGRDSVYEDVRAGKINIDNIQYYFDNINK